MKMPYTNLYSRNIGVYTFSFLHGCVSLIYLYSKLLYIYSKVYSLLVFKKK